MPRTQVAIVGAGPAGLLLAHLLRLRGIDSVVLERQSREHVERRIRAGVLEQGSVDLLASVGLADRLLAQRLVHTGVELLFDGTGHRIPLTELAGRELTIYGQHELVKDLVAARLATGEPLLFDAPVVAVEDHTGSPVVRYVHEGREVELRCDFVAGCDGYHGVSRASVPAGALTAIDHAYPYAWLGVLANVAPSSAELVYAAHERGFALHSMRSPTVTRLYLQVAPDEDLASWPDSRVWTELGTRLARGSGFALRTGEIVDKAVTALRGFVVEPMRHGRLFLAGDAAHIVPATGAKGLNLAVVDVAVLASALSRYYADGDESGLDSYSATCLSRVWRAQHFSWWMTSMLHRPPDEDPFARRLRLSQLRYLTSSHAAATSFAENYVGLPFPEGVP
ncbi:4-hydroxybenzoate 3-monooxygenase [Actinophytocola xinjiangensis]|uniref:4-hydroxybenzoate 3-monooxygenase n=1 Tax=Actinophytocola xinjiangensis TaxID=485602 RepID=A0A7Z1AVX2_9PSEU|nr:4-hydroxybenzoate 3-monooxygenase [Actinophytocola xinjiangensis]OLF06216.1 4-hydroxybenzoate 3-monooxygenase [Actinophytocola xinjiangensis]